METSMYLYNQGANWKSEGRYSKCADDKMKSSCGRGEQLWKSKETNEYSFKIAHSMLAEIMN